MVTDSILLLIIVIIAAAALSLGLTIKCNDIFIQRYGKGIISYGWAGVCGFFGLMTISSFGGGTNERFLLLIVTIVLTVISTKKCRQRAAEMGVDEEMTKKAMFIQFIAPIGLVGIILALSAGGDKKDNDHKRRRK